MSDEAELRPARVWWLAADEKAIEKDLLRAERIRQRRRKRRHPARIEDIDVRICRPEELGVDGEEEAAGLELIVFDLAVECAQRPLADREDVVAHDIPLLLREDRLQPHRPDFGDSLDAVVPARDAGGDVAGGRRLESHVPDFESLHQLAAAAFVVDRDVVRRIELPLRIVVEIDVNALGDDAARLRRELKIDEWLEGAPAVYRRIEEESR